MKHRTDQPCFSRARRVAGQFPSRLARRPSAFPRFPLSHTHPVAEALAREASQANLRAVYLGYRHWEKSGIKRVCCASSARSSLCSANSTRDGRSGRGGRARPAAVGLVLLGLPSEYIWPRFHSGQIGGSRQVADFQDNCVLMSHLPFPSGLWIQPPPRT